MRTDNGKEFQKSFARLCRALAIHHVMITVGNSKGNGQAKRTIRVVKDVIRRCMTKDPDTYWSNHLPPAGMLLRFAAHRATRLPAFRLATGRLPVLPITLPPLPRPAPGRPHARRRSPVCRAPGTNDQCARPDRLWAYPGARGTGQGTGPGPSAPGTLRPYGGVWILRRTDCP